MNNNNKQQNQCLLFAVAGVMMLILGAVTLESDCISGILTSFSLFAFLTSTRLANSKKRFLLIMLFLWLGHCIRFINTFNGSSPYSAELFLAILAYCALLVPGFVLDYYLVEKKKAIFSPVAFPLYYAVFTYIITKINIGDMFCLTAYLATIPVVAQMYALVCSTAVIFFIILILSLFSYAFIFKKDRALVLSAIGILVVSIVGIGVSRLWNQKKPDVTLKVASATTKNVDFFRSEGTANSIPSHDYLKLLEDALIKAKQGDADLLVTNEEYISFNNVKEPEYENEMSNLIKKYQIPVLVGIEYYLGEDEPGTNKVCFYDKDGNIIQTYKKHTLIPFLEASSYTEGDDVPKTLKLRVGDEDINISTIICFDINNISYLDESLSDDTELLLVPAWDWDTVNLEQRHTAVKSIDYNTTIFKSTMDGFTYVSGPYGLCGDMVDTRGKFESVSFIDVPIWSK